MGKSHEFKKLIIQEAYWFLVGKGLYGDYFPVFPTKNQ